MALLPCRVNSNAQLPLASAPKRSVVVFSIAENKMFAILGLDSTGKGKLAFKVDNDLFLAFTDRPGIRPAPYLARARWVAMEAPYPMAADELRALLMRAHQLIALRLPKYRQEAFRIGPET